MKRGRRRNYEFRQRPRDPAAVFPGADGSRSSGPRATGSGAGSRQAARGGGGLVAARLPHLSPSGGGGGSEPWRDSERGGGPRASQVAVVASSVLFCTERGKMNSSSKEATFAVESVTRRRKYNVSKIKCLKCPHSQDLLSPTCS
ncbi:uncharacterized protein ACBT57_017119 isoform 1-T2 [Dama dama]